MAKRGNDKNSKRPFYIIIVVFLIVAFSVLVVSIGTDITRNLYNVGNGLILFNDEGLKDDKDWKYYNDALERDLKYYRERINEKDISSEEKQELEKAIDIISNYSEDTKKELFYSKKQGATIVSLVTRNLVFSVIVLTVLFGIFAYLALKRIQ